MDRTSQIGVFVCAVLLIGLYLSTPAPKKVPHPAATAQTATTTTTTAPLTSPAANGGVSQEVSTAMSAAPATPVAEQLAFLENDTIRITLTSAGAAIKEIELKTHKEGTNGNVVLNEKSQQNVLALGGWPGAQTASFTAAQTNPTGITYTTTLPNGIKWERLYTLGKDYAVNVRDNLTNTGASEVTLPAYSLSVGRAQPLRVGGHYQSASNQYLGSGWLASKFYLTTITQFDPGYFLFIKNSDGRDVITSTSITPDPLKWLGVENQFFAVLLTPQNERLIPHAAFQCYNKRDAEGMIPKTDEPDIEATGFFPEVKIHAGQTIALDYMLYSGPKEYDRLNALGRQQGDMMNYGMFELLIVPMLRVLHFFHGWIGSYGLAIILLTLCIKAITWPLQSIANRSGKRMQALAPKLKELQAKYKDQPEKLNTETFGMYREYGVNPFGGCLPALIQMPVFFSLYFMLQNAVELRGQSFLWIHDLTQPDTVASVALPFMLPFGMGSHLTLNPLPLMVTGLTMIMMRMTPQIGDPQQAKIAQWMPLIFLFIFYNFAAALSLYYVINNAVSILQIYRNLRKPLPELKRVVKKKA